MQMPATLRDPCTLPRPAAPLMQQSLTEVREQLASLVENGLLLASERDRDKLLRHILMAGKRICNADAATLYLKTEGGGLRFALRSRSDHLPSVEIPLIDPHTGRPDERHVCTNVALNNKSVFIDDVYTESRFDLSGTRHFDLETGYRTVSMLAVPMAPRGGEVIGVLQFINATDRQSGQVVAFSRQDTSFVEALAAQAAVALENHHLMAAQNELIDAMVRILAGAIDAKSAHTGGHCERVPQLAMMLAEEACGVDSGPLADFRFASADEWREFRIGAWLHDCGKITTPEHIVEKATKLEVIHNRIHEVRLRFEILRRDAEIARLQARLDGVDAAVADAAFAASVRELEDDFAFVAGCNIGGETLAASAVERLHAIAGRTWLRHFDDRLGLSNEELSRVSLLPPAPLPAQERLLADKPHHLIPRPASPGLDPAYGFRMKVPEHLYNQGELYNLCVSRGTLTAEDRYKINEHIMQTIVMLEQLPLPKNLRRVPEYAGTHHETLSGSGYPRGLGQEDLSVPARIMAIADIFEALTACDRPYKKAKTLSESIAILAHLKQIGHIDPDLFDLFLSTGLYRRYGERYLKPEQMDDVDVAAFIGNTGKRA
jgi:HD-GYP domain-containing protein (c-di-GMP phosphodiesterase class II)